MKVAHMFESEYIFFFFLKKFSMEPGKKRFLPMSHEIQLSKTPCLETEMCEGGW
jgi:hypothetical protein